MLRGEPGIYYEDLYPLVCFLPRYAYRPTSNHDLLPMWQASLESTGINPLPQARHRRGGSMPLPSTSTGHYYYDEEDVDMSSWYQSYRPRRRGSFDPEKVLPMVTCEYPLKPARNPPGSSIFDYLPILRPIRRLFHILRQKLSGARGFSALGQEDHVNFASSTRTMLGKEITIPVESNTPLEIALYLSSYLAWLLKNGYLQAAIATAMTNNIITLQDAVLSLDRIRSTPLPFAYQAHLRFSLWLVMTCLVFESILMTTYLQDIFDIATCNHP
jgi:putative membrane protein